MTQLFAITRPGFNVLTEPNPNNYIFNSAYNTFKILVQEKQQITTIAGSHTYQIAHNAPSVPPLLSLFCQFPDGKVAPLSFVGSLSYNNAYLQSDFHSVDQVWWDNTNINLFIASVASPYNINVVWFVYEPTLV